MSTIKKQGITNRAIFDMAVQQTLAENYKRNGNVREYGKASRKADKILSSIKREEIMTFTTTVNKLKQTDKFKEYCEKYFNA